MIRVLDKNLTDKIAAGEVIERPVSIIKELVENSIDAGSSKITVEILNGGKSYIRVSDNGIGIAKNEVEIAFLRHATSKISSINDLYSIDTLGFRGEALASITAVSRLEIITKTKDSKTAKHLLMSGGEIISNDDIGSEDGTTIIVRDLFFNTPARLKFLKADNVESTKIIEYLSELALYYTNIQFRFINNHQVVFNTLGNGDKIQAINRLFTDINTNSLVELAYFNDDVTITGYISNPQLSKSNSKSQIFFVNGRVIDSKVIEKGIKQGYKERLFEGRFPICFIFIDVNPNSIDVNIHPNKREVRFNNESLIIAHITNAINEALKTKESIPNMEYIFKDKSINSEENHIEVKQMDIKTLLSTNASTEYFVNKNNDIVNEYINLENNLDEINDSSKIIINKPNLKPFDFNDITIIGTIFNTYIEAIDENSFYLIDQHAAQERIFYEKLIKQYDSIDKEKQTLMIPIIINTSVVSSNDKNNWFDKLVEMGFTINEFGINTYRITEIPMFMDISEAELFVNNFIDNINSTIDLRNKVIVDKLIMMSCKASIKANDKISIDEAKALIKDLKNCINPFSCPHGRPTVIKFTKYELEKMFKRVQ